MSYETNNSVFVSSDDADAFLQQQKMKGKTIIQTPHGNLIVQSTSGKLSAKMLMRMAKEQQSILSKRDATRTRLLNKLHNKQLTDN